MSRRGRRPQGDVVVASHFAEIADGVARVKPIALRMPLDPSTGEPDLEQAASRTFHTSAGLTFVYNVIAEEAAFLHHVSLLRARGPLARDAAETIVAYLCDLLRLPLDGVIVLRADQEVYHLMFRMDAEEHDRYREASVEVPEREALEDALRRAEQAREQLHVSRA